MSWGSLTGLETIRVPLSPGGQEDWAPLNLLRNCTTKSTTAVTTGTVALTTTTGTLIFTAALTGGIVLNLPPNPPDGQVVTVVNGTGATFTGFNIVATPTDGSTVVNNTAAALAAGTSAVWAYNAVNTTWYKVR